VKKKLQTSLLLLAAAGCLLLLYRHFFPNEEKRIRRMLGELAEVTSIPNRPTPTGNLAAVNRLRDFLATEVEVDVEVPGEHRHSFVGRQEIVQAALAARANLQGLKVELFDVTVTLDPGRETATVNLTVRVTQGSDRDFLVEELKLRLKQEDRQWRLTKAETVRTLKL
jgi:hypothetical protein